MANDPIFWLYHCNIDRIWASWNQAGGHNPTDDGFLGQTFTFVDETGKPLQSKVADVLYTGPLGYVHDRYLDRPPDSVPFLNGSGLHFTKHAASRGIHLKKSATKLVQSRSLAIRQLYRMPSAY